MASYVLKRSVYNLTFQKLISSDPNLQFLTTAYKNSDKLYRKSGSYWVPFLPDYINYPINKSEVNKFLSTKVGDIIKDLEIDGDYIPILVFDGDDDSFGEYDYDLKERKFYSSMQAESAWLRESQIKYYDLNGLIRLLEMDNCSRDNLRLLGLK